MFFFECLTYAATNSQKFFWQLEVVESKRQQPGLSGAGLAISVPAMGAVCINTNYVPATMAGAGNAPFAACVSHLNQGTAGFKTLSVNHLNRLIRLTSAKAQQKPLIASEQPKLSSNRLANITVQLILSELNHVPGGFHLNPGDLIDVKLLTEEQRKVLMNHHGLIKEALRQLKAQLAVESAQVTA